MRLHTILATILAFGVLLPSSTTHAQNRDPLHNDAVRSVGGQRVVDLPPAIPGYSPTRRPPKLDGPAGGRYMVETPTGLVQCTSPMVERESCEPSDLGQVQRWRSWVIKRQGQWQVCAEPVVGSQCQALIYVPKAGEPRWPPPARPMSRS